MRPSKSRSTDGVELVVEETGREDGPTIVLVHGLGFSRDVWRRQLDGKLATRFHLVAYDLRGHGQSSRPQDAAAYKDGRRWGEDLHAVLEATHATNAVVVGWSLGGLAIAEYLRGHGDAALGGVVFVDAVTAFAPEMFTKENSKHSAALTTSDDGARKEATERFARACFATPPPASELGPWLAAAGVLPASIHTAVQHMDVGEIEPALRGLGKPTLVIQGRLDELVAPAMARYTASIVRGARESVYEGSGHAPFVDETRRFDEELEAFVDAAGRTREQR